MSTSPARLREELQELAAGLAELHRALLAEQRAEHERAHGAVGAGQLLHLATSDPAFSWLRVLSEFMADLDALLDEPEPPSELEAGALRWELEEVFSAAWGTFWDRCVPLLQVPAVSMAYSRVRAALARLPKPPPPGGTEEARANHRWAVARSQRRRR
jgi:hypothetical protein